MRTGILKRAVSTAAVFVLLAACSGAALALELIPGGTAVGIEMETDGILITGLNQIETDDGVQTPAADAGLLPGDVIVRIGDGAVRSAAELAQTLSGLDGSPVTVTVRRDGRLIQYTLEPACSTEGVWKLGLLLRDGVAGIGTITYIDPESGAYGALGHGVCDTETGVLIPISDGQIMHAAIERVVPGRAGTPGELCGVFDAGCAIGTIERNTGCGIFGHLHETGGGQALETVPSGELKTGPVQIRASISGEETRDYDAEIMRVYRSGSGETRFLLAVTDETLLEQTGGIVQGMSGSPIIQDGKLVGAVTHVLVNDPTKGYGIFIENMLEAAE